MSIDLWQIFISITHTLTGFRQLKKFKRNCSKTKRTRFTIAKKVKILDLVKSNGIPRTGICKNYKIAFERKIRKSLIWIETQDTWSTILPTMTWNMKITTQRAAQNWIWSLFWLIIANYFWKPNRGCFWREKSHFIYTSLHHKKNIQKHYFSFIFLSKVSKWCTE